MTPTRPRIATLAALAAGLAAAPGVAQSPPASFEITTIATGLDEPVALAFAPDGRLFVAERGGRVRIVADGQVLDPPLLELTVHRSNESGLLGLALDPAFAENHYVYLFATVTPDEQQILRFTERGGLGEDLTVIRGNLPTTGDLHNGGGLRVAPDGTLFFSIGDTGRPELSPRLDSLAGKICRIHLDGSIPEDNPLATPTGSRRAVYAMGFRNPFRFCFASDGRLFVGDVGSDGPARSEEITLIGPAGDGGWPATEGMFDAAAFPEYTLPLIAYRDDGAAVAGCVVYEDAQFPAAYHGNLFHLDYVSKSLFRVVLDGDRAVARELFMNTDDVAVDLCVSPDGGLVYGELFSGAIRKVTYTGADGPGDNPTSTPAEAPEPADPRGTQSTCGAGSMALILMSAALWPLAAARRRSDLRIKRAAC
jgi:glucose/arabinose dehydrogenase